MKFVPIVMHLFGHAAQPCWNFTERLVIASNLTPSRTVLQSPTDSITISLVSYIWYDNFVHRPTMDCDAMWTFQSTSCEVVSVCPMNILPHFLQSRVLLSGSSVSQPFVSIYTLSTASSIALSPLMFLLLSTLRMCLVGTTTTPRSTPSNKGGTATPFRKHLLSIMSFQGEDPGSYLTYSDVTHI